MSEAEKTWRVLARPVYGRLVAEVNAAALPRGESSAPVADVEIDPLPEAAQRYLRFMGVAGRPRDWSFYARFVGRFRRTPGDRWLPAEAWQYNSARPVARVFVLRVRIAHLVPMVGRDTYLGGRGRMVGTLLGLRVVDGSGDDFDLGELMTYLNDAVLLAPTTLLVPAVS